MGENKDVKVTITDPVGAVLSSQEEGGVSLLPQANATTMSSEAPSVSSLGGVAGTGPTSLLTSQLLEAHNILQQQGGSGMGGVALSQEEGGVVDSTPSGSGNGGVGMNISPELLAQVSSFLNLPGPSPLSGHSPSASLDALLGTETTPLTTQGQY